MKLFHLNVQFSPFVSTLSSFELAKIIFHTVSQYHILHILYQLVSALHLKYKMLKLSEFLFFIIFFTRVACHQMEIFLVPWPKILPDIFGMFGNFGISNRIQNELNLKYDYVCVCVQWRKLVSAHTNPLCSCTRQL